MIQIFRKIRRRLLTENKFSKYLLYAIGEIILVMIGILMALQVNNWSNERADRKKEIILLKEIQQNLETNVKQFTAEAKMQGEIVESISLIMDQIKNKVPYHDSLGVKYASIAWTEEFNFANSAFETLKTIGFDLISSDPLRENIIQLFNIRYTRISDVIQKVSVTDHSQLNLLYHKYLEFDTQGNAVVVDSENLFKDIEFTNMLSGRRIWKIDIISTYKELIEESLALSQMIDRELKQ